MKLLYLGGTGEISFDCVHESVRRGHEVHVFNRGRSNAGLPPAPAVTYHTGDYTRDADLAPLAELYADAVISFRTFTVDQLERDLKLFTGHAGRYAFVSSASAYHKPVTRLPITEDTPLHNPYWEYSRDKIACEARLTAQSQLPYTIVRPSHTTRTALVNPVGGGDLLASRLLRGRPIVLPGDGTSVWTLTASADFAPPFVKLLETQRSLGQAYHLTAGLGEGTHTWRQIVEQTAAALGVGAQIVGVPTDRLVAAHPDWLGPLWGDKAWSVVFDNAKLKSVVGDFTCPTPLDQMMRDRVEHWRARGGPELEIDRDTDQLLDRLAAEHRP
jgi:nucleoside-diphosphate-sugar epimerase